MSAWIEIAWALLGLMILYVALFVSAWIEIAWALLGLMILYVALFVSAWIEMPLVTMKIDLPLGRTLCECVD